MRFTLLHPDPARGAGLHPTDVEADVGTTLTDLRPALARVSGYPGWASAGVRTAVADAVLDDHHVVGQPPLVEGCVLRTGAGTRAEETLAVGSPWHVAVAAGPDSGGLVALPADSTVTVRPSGPCTALGPVLVVDDPTLPRLRVRRRGERVHVRVGHLGGWRRWRVDRPRRLGDTTLVLRRSPDGTEHAAPDEPTTATRPATWLTPLVGSLALAAALRQPLLALAGLAVPLVVLGGAAISRWRRRRRPRGDTSVHDVAALVAATVRAAVTPAEPAALDQPWDPGGSLAVVGPRSLALPVARAVVVGTLGTHLTGALAVRTRYPDDWAWCVWAAAAHASPLLGADAALVVADDPADPAELARWRSSAPSSQRLLVLAASAAAVPAWCRTRLEVGPRGVRLHDAAGRVQDVPRSAVSEERALAQVRAAAAARAVTGAGGIEATATVPVQASLAALDGIPAPHGVAVAWSAPRAGLVAALGVGPGSRTASVDLVADGPHALVAGTTGAGKSELLTTLVLGLALTHPPDRLAILLVDFKGGTGLGPVAGLPHVLEHVTDLDPAHARRVLTALRAELRRREAILAVAGARDLAELDPAAAGTPPRLLVVVDELRALTEDVPDAAAALTRIAAQGRALGVHLVLATQRPAGAVGADLRANVALRIALRVTDHADSTDVLDAPDAALIDPALPGRAWVRRGTRAPEPVQVARAVATPATSAVRLARPWSGDGAGWCPDLTALPSEQDAVQAWVRATQQVAARRPQGEQCPWLPALPQVVRRADVPEGTGLAIGLSDLPDEQRRGAVRWDPADGPLLVLGGPRSGRTTTVLTAALDALEHGWTVHAVGLPPDAVARLRAGDRYGGLGSVLDTGDARAVARLLELVVAAPVRATTLVVVDRLDLLLESLGRLARGAGAERLTALWRGNPGAALVGGADAGAAALQHAAAFAHRLVLPLPDAALDALAGVPTVLAGPRTTPGRAVHLHPGGAQLCQVILPARPTEAIAHPPGRGSDAVLVRTLPVRADPPGTPDRVPDRWAVPLGPGGDDAAVVWADVADGLLVAGPPGSGRSTALAVVAAALVSAEVGVVRLVDPTGVPTPSLPGVRDVGPDDVVAVCGQDDGPPTVLIDDLDDLELSRPGLAELLLAGPAPRLVATVTSASAVRAFRGAVPTLLRRRRLLVLDAHDPASAELVGPRAAWCVDPDRRPAGRGVLLRGRETVVVQVYSGGS